MPQIDVVRKVYVINYHYLQMLHYEQIDILQLYPE